MKKLYIIAWSLFFASLVLRFLHISGNGLLMLISCVMLLIHNIIYLCKHIKTEKTKVLLYFSYTFLTIYVLLRILYWQFAQLVFSITLFLVLAALTVHFVKKKPFKLPQIVLVIYFVFFLVFSYVPSYKIFYVVNLNTVLNKERRNTDYYSWNKYSWFLHLRGKKNEALDANKEAQKAIELCVEKGIQLPERTRGCMRMIENNKLIILNEQEDKNNEWYFFVPID